MAEYVRYRASTPNARGAKPGIFAVMNGLAASGALSADEQIVWRSTNDWFNAVYPTPPAEIYVREFHPEAASWFRTSALHLIERTETYREIVTRHRVAVEIVETDNPGIVIYSDEFQIVAAASQLLSQFRIPDYE
jgi:hypothetical protein